jgi:hypothetical protein
MEREIVFTAEHKANIRKSALMRESVIRKKVSVDGIVYDNIVRAAKGTGHSPRSVARYAADPRPQYKNYFYM